MFHDISKIASKISFSFANLLLSSFADRINGNEFEDEKEQEEIMSFIACIAQMNPMAALENLDKLMKPWKDASDASLIRTTKCKSELISVFLFLPTILLSHTIIVCDLLDSFIVRWMVFVSTYYACVLYW